MLGGGDLKRLDLACEEFGVTPDEAVFVGDNFNGRDKRAANFHRVRFLQVPQYRQNLPDWCEQDRNEGVIIYDQHFNIASLINKL
jgi:phosphoglycolate phosphatase-like HAD superfamily hydrolase